MTPIVRDSNSSIFCTLSIYVHFSFANILTGKRELVALLSLYFWCLVIVVWCHGFVLVVFTDDTHYFCSDYQGNACITSFLDFEHT